MKSIILSVALGALTVFPVALPVQAQNQGPVLPPAPPGDPLNDPIRPFDDLRVIVAGADYLSGVLRVDADGLLQLPGLKAIKVGKLSRAQAQDLLAKAILDAKLLKRPETLIQIVGRKAREAKVGGAVQVATRQVLRQGDQLSDVLGRAVIQTGADLSRVTITRGEEKKLVNYRRFASGQADGDDVNPVIEDGDAIFVPAGEVSGGTVRVRGEVRSPDKAFLAISDGATVGQILQLAGGVTELGDRAGIYIQREGVAPIPVPYEEIVKGIAGRDIVLRDKDEIVVPRREKPKQFVVTGAVARQGNAAFPLNTRMTLIEAIGAAGGFLDGAKRDKIEVRRQSEEGKVATIKLDFRKDKDAAFELRDGDTIDVPFGGGRRGFNLNEALGALSSFAFIFQSLGRR